MFFILDCKTEKLRPIYVFKDNYKIIYLDNKVEVQAEKCNIISMRVSQYCSTDVSGFLFKHRLYINPTDDIPWHPNKGDILYSKRPEEYKSVRLTTCKLRIEEGPSTPNIWERIEIKVEPSTLHILSTRKDQIPSLTYDGEKDWVSRPRDVSIERLKFKIKIINNVGIEYHEHRLLR